jgi:hypothetical protein
VTLLLNPRLWIALALAGVLAFSHLTAYRKGKHAVRIEWDAAVASANTEARRLEQARQRRADEAAALAAAREGRIRADADRAAGAVRGLRDELAALRARSQSCPAEAERTAAVGELLRECGEAYQELGRAADRHVNDVRVLLESWPR